MCLERANGTHVSALEYDWRLLARPDQLPPQSEWSIWLLLGGRGAGKTRAGAEWVREQVRGEPKRIALVAPSYGDAREVMIEGESGLKNIGFPLERPYYESSRRRLIWPNGSVGYVYSAEDADGLRGPQFHAAWADEFCAWSYPSEALSNLRLGLRLGDEPRLVMTTTPRPIKALRSLMCQRGIELSRAGTQANAIHLSPAFIETVFDTYGNTRLGRQELDGEILTESEGALWSRDLLETCHVKDAPAFEKTIVAVDPPVSGGNRADSCGIIIAARAGHGKDAIVYILEDATVQGLMPEKWAKRVMLKWEMHDADFVLAEINQGGQMIRSVFRAIGADVPLRTVYASKGKTARAEPVAALYEQGRVKHLGALGALEDEMCTMVDGRVGGKSPDRTDAMVWAVTELLLSARHDPQIRHL